MKLPLPGKASRVPRHGRCDLRGLARRGLPWLLAFACVGSAGQCLYALATQPAALASLSWQRVAVIGALCLLQLAAAVCAFIRPRVSLWLLLDVLAVHLLALPAGGITPAASLPLPGTAGGEITGMHASLINTVIAYALWRVRPRAED